MRASGNYSISDVIGLLTVWRHNKPKTKNQKGCRRAGVFAQFKEERKEERKKGFARATHSTLCCKVKFIWCGINIFSWTWNDFPSYWNWGGTHISCLCVCRVRLSTSFPPGNNSWGPPFYSNCLVYCHICENPWVFTVVLQSFCNLLGWKRHTGRGLPLPNPRVPWKISKFEKFCWTKPTSRLYWRAFGSRDLPNEDGL